MYQKISALAFVTTFFAVQSFAQTVMTIGKTEVSKDEFWNAYSKNKTTNLKDEKAILEYAQLYSNFKLKVKAAQDMRMDTVPQIISDVANFRSQIADNYLADEAAVQRLEQEAFDRSQQDVHALHYSINVTPGNEAAAKKQIEILHEALIAGDEKKALTIEQVKQQDLGYITVFSVPYSYENIIYETPVGKYSQPFYRSNAWHIIKVEGSRPASGTWKVAQVLLAIPPNSTVEEQAVIKLKADSIYKAIKKGLPFGEAAKLYSNDRITNLTEGLLPEFGTGKFKADFEDKVFALKKDGDITFPFLTNYGYHIVKRISVKEVPADKKDAVFMYEQKQKIATDVRLAQLRTNFEDEIVKITGFKFAPKMDRSTALALLKDTANAGKKEFSARTLASFGAGNKITEKDWLTYAVEYRMTHEDAASATGDLLWDMFVKYTAIKQYKENLEAYSQSYKNQVKEFTDGNMLFEVMDKMVWTKASADEAALKSFYNANMQKYKWDKSADVIIYNCTDKATAEEVMKASKAGKAWRAIQESAVGNVIADSGRYELDQLIAKENSPNPTTGGYSSIVVNTDNAASFIYYLKMYAAGDQRAFEDARGLVINDYQDKLEEEWLATIRKKYPVTINYAALKELKN